MKSNYSGTNVKQDQLNAVACRIVGHLDYVCQHS